MLKNNNLKPIYDKNCKVLLLGSFPGKVSNSLGRYYANKGNRFWYIIKRLFNDVDENAHRKDCIPNTFEEQKQYLLSKHIAVSDVMHKVDSKNNSSDSDLNLVENTDLDDIFKANENIKVFTLGKKATEYYENSKYNQDHKTDYLPSTSGAYGKMDNKEIIDKFNVILEYLKGEK